MVMWEEKIILRHSGRVIWASCSPSGDYAASFGEDMCIMVYSFKENGVYAFIKSLGPGFTCACWSPYNLLAIAFKNQGIYFWDIDRKKGLKKLLRHRAQINCMSWLNVLATGGEDKAIIIWDVDRGERLMVLRKHKKGVLTIDWSPDGKYLVSGGRDKRVFIWEMGIERPLVELPNHTDIVVAVAFSNDGRFIASCTRDGILRIWRFGTWRLHKTVKLESAPQSISWGPDDRRIAIACGDGKIAILDLPTLRLESFNAHKECTTVADWCQQWDVILSGGGDGIVKLWKKRSQPF